jgi:hypothetical protein
MILRCRYIKTDGNVCGSIALNGRPYCYYHARLHTFAKAPSGQGEEPLVLPVLEDQRAIQLALTQIMTAIATKRIDRKQAALFFRGLQIAQKNLDYDFPATLLKTVKNVALTEEGEELAPENQECERPQDCKTCTNRCRRYQPEND